MRKQLQTLFPWVMMGMMVATLSLSFITLLQLYQTQVEASRLQLNSFLIERYLQQRLSQLDELNRISVEDQGSILTLRYEGYQVLIYAHEGYLYEQLRLETSFDPNAGERIAELDQLTFEHTPTAIRMRYQDPKLGYIERSFVRAAGQHP